MITFSDALNALKTGRHIRRLGWNGKDMYLFLRRGTHDISRGFDDTGSGSRVSGISLTLFDPVNTVPSEKTILPCIGMKTSDGCILYGWLASQTDILADDWEVVT